VPRLFCNIFRGRGENPSLLGGYSLVDGVAVDVGQETGEKEVKQRIKGRKRDQSLVQKVAKPPQIGSSLLQQKFKSGTSPGPPLPSFEGGEEYGLPRSAMLLLNVRRSSILTIFLLVTSGIYWRNAESHR